uniref:Uncharacterized protein n=1 Tax=Meloidogyne enterolobii TaxID=390850 RepID=A0A6V7V5U6_MELEN|nr:unnamed protein product [Meloidogyne enterolobii]
MGSSKGTVWGPFSLCQISRVKGPYALWGSIIGFILYRERSSFLTIFPFDILILSKNSFVFNLVLKVPFPLP